MKRILALTIPLFIAACAAISPGCLDTTRDVTFTVYTYNNATPPAAVEGVSIFIYNSEITDNESSAGETDSNGFLSATRTVECGSEIEISALPDINIYKPANTFATNGAVDCDHPTYTFYLEPK